MDMEARDLSYIRILEDNHIKTWLSLTNWLLTINAGGVVAILSYLASKGHNSQDIKTAFKAFILGSIFSLMLLAVNFFITRFRISEYDNFLRRTCTSQFEINKTFEQSCTVKCLEKFSWLLGILSFTSIIVGSIFGFIGVISV